MNYSTYLLINVYQLLFCIIYHTLFFINIINIYIPSEPYFLIYLQLQFILIQLPYILIYLHNYNLHLYNYISYLHNL